MSASPENDKFHEGGRHNMGDPLKRMFRGKSWKPSFTKQFLVNHPHELPKMIVDAREINKARTTFIDSILNLI